MVTDPHYSPDGAWARVLYRPGAGSHCLQGTALHELQSAAGGSEKQVCKERLGRPTPTRTVTFTLTAQAIYADVLYDYAARPVVASEPAAMSYAFNQVASSLASRARNEADDQIFNSGFSDIVAPSDGPIPSRVGNYADERFSSTGEFRRAQDGSPKPHWGADYKGVAGDPIQAASDGEVVHVGTMSGFGRSAVIQSIGTIGTIEHTLYAHLDEYFVREGQQVFAGQVVGAMGYSGNPVRTAPHLHFEVSHNGWGRGSSRLDPERSLGREP